MEFLGQYTENLKRKVYFLQDKEKTAKSSIVNEVCTLENPVVVFLNYTDKNLSQPLIEGLIKAGITYFVVITTKDEPHKLENTIDGEIVYLVNEKLIPDEAMEIVTTSYGDISEGIESLILITFNVSFDDPIIIIAPDDYKQEIMDELRRVEKELSRLE